MKKHITFALLFAAALTAQAQQGGISGEMLNQIKQSYKATPADKAIRNALGGTSINTLALNQENRADFDTEFSHKVLSKGITDQQSSGRCWLFTGLNVLYHGRIIRIQGKDDLIHAEYVFQRRILKEILIFRIIIRSALILLLQKGIHPSIGVHTFGNFSRILHQCTLTNKIRPTHCGPLP